MAQTGQHQLKIGDSIRITRGFMTQIRLLYAGMVNERALSLVVTTTTGHMGMAYNLYLPLDQRHLEIAQTSVTIESVSPTTVLLTLG